MEAEPDNAETVKEFSKKIGTALKRMEQLIIKGTPKSDLSGSLYSLCNCYADLHSDDFKQSKQ